MESAFHLGKCSITDSVLEGDWKQRGMAGIEFQDSNEQLMCRNVNCSFFQLGIVCRGTSHLWDCLIHHCSKIGVWIDNTEDPIFCRVQNCAIMRCLEGIRCYSTNLSVTKCIIVKVNVALHCDHALALLVQNNCIHECTKVAMVMKNVRLLQFIDNAVYDCSAGCDLHTINTCQIMNNCLIFIKNQLFSFRSCFV